MTAIQGWDTTNLNLELFFCTDILKLDSLHYGYWEKPERLDLESIRRAQTRYTRTLVDFIPDHVKDILDVGCGIGDVTFALASRGYSVTAISPDHNHARFFRKALEVNQNLAVKFENVRLEDFDTNQKFDLMLMSESQDYFDMELGFSQCQKHLRPGGYLLVSGHFRKAHTDHFTGSQVEQDYIRCAERFGMQLEKRVDITENVLPTLEFGNLCFQDYLQPTMKLLNIYLGNKAQMKLGLIKWLFNNEYKKLERVQQ